MKRLVHRTAAIALVLIATAPPSEWPPHIRALKPVQVFVNAKGVTMYIDSVYWNVTGIYIRYDPSFEPPATIPPDSDETRYERLAPDIYWFSRPR